MNKDELRTRASKIEWFHKFELAPGVMTEGPGLITEAERAKYFEIPEDLSGKRVLDIGCADGFFTFLAESRGARVVAIDAWPHQGFTLAHEALGSQAEFHQMDLYELGPDTFGMFDVVFFMGVYYHLKNPLLALERIASVTRELAIIESQIMTPSQFEEDEASSRFYEHDGLAPGDPTNWWVPSPTCLTQTVRAAGFPRAKLVNRYSNNSRGVVHAFKGPRTAGKILTEDIVCLIHTPGPNAEIDGTVSVSGVAFSKLDPEGGIERVTVYLDHLDDPVSELGQAMHNQWRPALVPRVGEKYGAIGFEFTWDTTGVTSGEHTLYILVEGKYGWHCSRQPVTIRRTSSRKFLSQAFRRDRRPEANERIVSHTSSDNNLLPPSEGYVSDLKALNETIGVSSSLPPNGGGNRLRRIFHNLVIYYVNMLAKRQRVFNQAIITMTKEIAEKLDQNEPRFETLQEEIITLRAKLQDMETKLDK